LRKGYDIACAQNDTPILYQIKNGQPTVKKQYLSPLNLLQNITVYLIKTNSKTA
jgi:hypothetical protein